MFNKILLASFWAEEKFEDLFCRLKITVGKSPDGEMGYKESSFGACEILEGDTVVYQCCKKENGDFSLKATMSYDIKERVFLGVNTTTGVKQKDAMTIWGGGVGEKLFITNLFDGIEVGQECIVEFYMASQQMSYWLNLAIALDQLLNAIFRGEPDEMGICLRQMI